MKIFISYSHKDKELAGSMKFHLQYVFGFDVFLAHEDIEPTHEWEDEIIFNLKSCDVLIALITENYNISEWTDQEAGFALARGIQIISINVGANPHGFIKRYQTLRYRTVKSTCGRILRILVENLNLRESAIKSLINAFGNSNTFSEATEKIARILEFETVLTSIQGNEIIRLAGLNNQIFQSWAARRRIANYILLHEFELNSELVTIFRSQFQT